MKVTAKITAIAAFLFFSAAAQTGPQYLNISISSNSLLQPVSMNMCFSDFGDHLLDVSDTLSLSTVVIINQNNSQTNIDSLPLIANNSIGAFTLSSDNVAIDIFDSRPILDSSVTFDFGMNSLLTDTITISASAFIDSLSSNLSNNTKINFVYLEDVLNATFYQILDENVTLIIPANSNFAANYKLHVIAKPTITTTPVTCFGGNDGTISIHNPYCYSWSYTIYDNGNPIFSSTASNPDTTFYNFTSQFWDVVIYNGTMLLDSQKVHVNSPAQIIPYYTTLLGNSVLTGDDILFINQTTGAVAYNWTYGDSTSDSLVNPNHTYLSQGNYPVTLTAINGNGCIATFTDTIFVSDPPFHLAPHFNRSNNSDPSTTTSRNTNSIEYTIATNNQKISVSQNEGQQIKVEVLNMNGQLVATTTSSDESVSFELANAGIYFINITASNGELVSKKIFVNGN